MTKLVWGAVGSRFFEAGVDQGVLFAPGQPGVPWNGLTTVSEKPQGADPTPFYIDGYKYANIAAGEEFSATIEAFSAPAEFGVCDGTSLINNGLMLTQQPRKSFGFSYRTKIGNDLDGLDYGYKIHLVYNALAAPAEKDNSSVSDKTDPLTLSWDISTAPPKLTGYKPTAHLVIDTTKTAVGLLAQLEAWIYGDDITVPVLPALQDLVNLFSQPWNFNAKLNGDGSYTIGGDLVQMTDTGITFTAEDDSIVDNGDGSFSVPETPITE